MFIPVILLLCAVLSVAFLLRGLFGILLASVALVSAVFLLRGVVLLFGDNPHPSQSFPLGLIAVGVAGFVALFYLRKRLTERRLNV